MENSCTNTNEMKKKKNHVTHCRQFFSTVKIENLREKKHEGKFYIKNKADEKYKKKNDKQKFLFFNTYFHFSTTH